MGSKQTRQNVYNSYSNNVYFLMQALIRTAPPVPIPQGVLASSANLAHTRICPGWNGAGEGEGNPTVEEKPGKMTGQVTLDTETRISHTRIWIHI